MTTDVLTIGDVRLTRVGYADVEIEPEIAGLTAADIAAHPWAEPTWANGVKLRAGAAVWFIEDGDARIAVDPMQAADQILRSEGEAAFHQQMVEALLADAGFARDTITHAVATHVEGIGMWAWRDDDGAWSPFFANARYYVSQRDLDAVDNGRVADDTGGWASLRAAGIVDGVSGDNVAISPHVSLQHTGAHGPGHSVVRVQSNRDAAIMVGHLAVSALHFATGECPQQHPDPASAERWLEKFRGEDTILIGPLWPSPGAGRWDADAQALRPVSER